jgi:DnaD/phage-associated family protein
MGTIKLDGQTGCSSTLVSNKFLDEYMPNASGEFVKIYLYLLRAFSNPNANISVCNIADIFNCTEKDVIRALRYWEHIGLLKLGFNENKQLISIVLLPVCDNLGNSLISENSATSAKSANIMDAASSNHISSDNKVTPTNKANINNANINIANTNNTNTNIISEVGKYSKKVYTANELATFKSQEAVIEFLYLAEKYIGKTLSGSDVNTLLYFYDVLGFDAELIEYLIEYCVTNGHKSLRYIEKVALSWADEGIDSIDKARDKSETFSKTCYPVLKAFGITGRNPGEDEKAFVVKWTNSYGFTMDIIIDACKRTLSATSKPSFKYADSILTKWHEKGIRNLSDVKELDIEHQKNKITYNQTHNQTHSSADKKSDIKSKNTFNDFNQRTYNYEALEKELLNNV